MKFPVFLDTAHTLLSSKSYFSFRHAAQMQTFVLMCGFFEVDGCVSKAYTDLLS